MISTGANTLHERSCGLQNPGYCATEELASSLNWGLDDDSFSRKMHAWLNLLLWCEILTKIFKKRCKNLCQSTLSILLLPPSCKTFDVLFYRSEWQLWHAPCWGTYKIFSQVRKLLFVPPPRITLLHYTVYIYIYVERGVNSLKCLWSV